MTQDTADATEDTRPISTALKASRDPSSNEDGEGAFQKIANENEIAGSLTERSQDVGGPDIPAAMLPDVDTARFRDEIAGGYGAEEKSGKEG